MTVTSGPGTKGTRHINTNWPIEEGLELGTTKLNDDWMLTPTVSNVSAKDRQGL